MRTVIDKPSRLDSYDIIVFAGGFSHGDDLAAGRVWGLELRTHVGDALRKCVDRGGLVLGVCNGFQVLIESGIFQPDRAPHERDIALYSNASNHYECRWVELQSHACRCPWLIDGEVMPTPVAHAEGRFVTRDAAALERLREAGQIALTYRTPETGTDYPANPNGSTEHIAGICDPTGRVLGLMPHPERNLTPWNNPDWSRLSSREQGEGLTFYRRMVETATEAVCT
ncbi:MAG: phosphoribosylformylglycinamidine synthase I [Planctomycetota bacterium]|jgi:phosphoribosylformylglycinamidine synthase I